MRVSPLSVRLALFLSVSRSPRSVSLRPLAFGGAQCLLERVHLNLKDEFHDFGEAAKQHSFSGDGMRGGAGRLVVLCTVNRVLIGPR